MKNPYTEWKNEDIDLLKKWRKILTTKEMQERFFPNRTIHSILHKCQRLGVICPNPMKNPNTVKKLSDKLKGIPKSEEHKEKIRNTLKQKYREGKILVWNTGKKMSEKQKRMLHFIKKNDWKNPNSVYNSKEWREKVSIAQKKKWVNPDFDVEARNKKISKKLKGRNITWKDKIGQTRIKLGLAKGEKNPNYKHGKSKEPYPMDWRDSLKNSIRQRDNHKCQICGVHQMQLNEKLCVHHIDENKENLNPDNLISLCRLNHLHIQKIQNDLKDYFYAINIGEIPRKK